jgi:hypothetical protein
MTNASYTGDSKLIAEDTHRAPQADRAGGSSVRRPASRCAGLSRRPAYSGVSTGHAGPHASPEPRRRPDDDTAPAAAHLPRFPFSGLSAGGTILR